jgi:hypothetical protein
VRYDDVKLLNALRRTNLPTHYIHYTTTRDQADLPSGYAADTSSRANTSTDTNLDTWPTDPFGNPNVVSAEIAHLIPHSYNRASLY